MPSGSRGASLTAMAHPAPAASRCTSEEFFELVARGVLAPDDRVELLEGVIVAMAPQNPRHATGVHMVHDAVSRAVGTRALVRQQFPLIAGLLSVPEPDVAVVPGSVSDYLDRHPTTALLVVEVADSSIVQDRLTKTAIYAAAGVPEYWVVDLVGDRVEVHRSPIPAERRYGETSLVLRGGRLDLVALPGASVAVDDLLPSRER